MQDFLARLPWDADRVRDDLRDSVIAHLGDPDALLVLDETGFLKKGTKSVGVQRPYSGTAGRIENGQIGVCLASASRHGHAFIDRALYLPEGWAEAPDRRQEAGVPPDVTFATKPKLGREMLARTFGAGVPCAFVTGDSVYGADAALRRFLAQQGHGYVLAVTSAQRLGVKPVEDGREDVPAHGWHRLSAGDGAKGERLYDGAWLRLGLAARSVGGGRRLEEGPAAPAHDRAAAGIHLLSHPLSRNGPPRPPRPGGRNALDRRVLHRRGQG